MKQDIIKGSILVRNEAKCVSGSRSYLFIGMINIDDKDKLKEDHTYQVLGSEVENDGITTITLQILTNSAKDVSKKVKGKNLTQCIQVLP